MATLLNDPRPQFRDSLGSVVAFGYLKFYDTGTTTPKDTYAEFACTTNNGSTITLTAAGRSPFPVWLSGNYTVELYDADDVLVWSVDNVRDMQSATSYALPNPASGTDGQVIQTDGLVYSLQTIRTLPDPTGLANYYLVTDGETWYAAVIPTETVYTSTSLPGGVVQGSTSFQIGKMLAQTGTGSAPTTSNCNTSVTVSFPTAYATLLHVSVSPSVGGIIDGGGAEGVTSGAISRSTSGFTANFTLATDHSSDHHVASAVAFSWVAFGLVA